MIRLLPEIKRWTVVRAHIDFALETVRVSFCLAHDSKVSARIVALHETSHRGAFYFVTSQDSDEETGYDITHLDIVTGTRSGVTSRHPQIDDMQVVFAEALLDEGESLPDIAAGAVAQ